MYTNLTVCCLQKWVPLFSGAVSSFTTGLIGGAAGQKVVGMAAKVAFGAANSAFGYATQTAIDHEAFNWESFGTSVLNGMATSLLPAKTPAGVSSFLSNSGSFLGDPTKSLSKKWQVEIMLHTHYFYLKKAEIEGKA